MKQNFIELVPVTFGAGESKLWWVQGQYFELIDAVNPVDVLLTDENGAQRGRMAAAEASFNLKNTDFKCIQITSATAQTIRFAYGTGEAGTRRAAGSVNVANAISIAPGQSLALVQATIDALTRPVLPGAAWNSTVTVAANTPLTIFNGAANPNGAIVWQMESNDNNGSAASIHTFVAKATPPANVADGEIIAQSIPVVGGAVYDWAIRREQPTRIAAGLGLYFISAAAGTAGRLRNCRYTLL